MPDKIGVVGLGVMGRNLAINLVRHGFSVVGYDLDADKINGLIPIARKETNITGAKSLSELIDSLDTPRCILLMVPAGQAVDEVIALLKPILKTDDILIDGGNSHFQDTERRYAALDGESIRFLGMGISGGEQGALWGPCLMPGGNYTAWETLAPMLRLIAAKAGDGQPCVEYIGPRGAGHYVKMVHNGIEYAELQLIAEVYHLLRHCLSLSASELSDIFEEWNEGELKSYLIEITAEILKKIDKETGKPLVELILDEAQQKGTGKWTSQNALDMGVPIPTINSAVESRFLSSLKTQRLHTSRIFMRPEASYSGNRQQLINAAQNALYAAKITAYAQGMALLQNASVEYSYNLNLSEITAIWRAGCIIRADLLEKIMIAYRQNPNLPNLMFDDILRGDLEKHIESCRFVVQTAIGSGIPVLALGASLGYFDAFRSEQLPANLIQAMRDCFGAHTYQRIDRQGVFHTEWY